ncbi:MAG TPA: AMP phosphorylase [Candidatus Methanoculleus thermohydrogenotrophicum]|jgi:AMP phosphorylase|nr:AMP phosphorylase [Candidatus Methanoculleus thermohydrogenotrophicum]NLM81723.1 AMP phosphorylase [Candidatus Methanoculleus thermohydrogenotrophicum]HOB17863.1 AMP phosphorylase [Candidatus Methanoculleus thermohydrogenotrophicum]HPZ37366.1 AMP phosphorylase [Candidatus Methanoculleus thermohydrogenotrophicum]HQC91238.1 AMP phosphorylase [Candidatus Methanoculleus thermohydrogenotrophicum]
MELTVKLLDIANRGVLLHSTDAQNIRVRDGDRIQIVDKATGKTARARVDTTRSLIEPGVIGIYRPLISVLEASEGTPVEVRGAELPRSLAYIRKKMDGGRFTKDETLEIIKDIVDDTLSPGEITAYVTASYINGLDMDEVEYLTRAMVETGERLRFTRRPIVDKHSIGGVPGNKITLLIVPIIAASGLRIPKTSSRAITGAGGTADLMEVLAPVSFSAVEIQKMTEKVGGVIVWGGATNIAPADDKIITHEYPFRIDARGQMIASVMAKKFAVGADLVVIDIPVGRNTKIETEQEGRKLAREFIELGERLGIRVECALSYGESPVGHTIGPNLEVREALAVLEGATVPNSLIQKSLSMAGIALEMAGKAAYGQGFDVAAEILRSGKALEKMRQIIEIQGGDPTVKAEDIKPGEYQFEVRAPHDGYVIELNNSALVTLARLAGSPYDHGAGIHIHAKKGARVKKGDPIFTIYADREWRLERAIETGRVLMPVVVEGMILERIPPERWA